MRDQLSKYLPAEDHRAILSRRKLFELAGLAVASAAIPPGMALVEPFPSPDLTGQGMSAVMDKLSLYMSEASGRELPDEVTEKTKQHILDTVAAMISGSELTPGRAALQFAGAYGGKEVATVVASKLLCGPIEAAFVNAMLAHADETDDSHAPSQSHPGCAVVPAALAAGERFGVDGHAFIRAVTLGYDIGTRVTMTVGIPGFETETHISTHALASLFGASAAAASAAGLSAQQMRWVLDYSVQQASGTKLWQRDTDHIEKAFVFAGVGARGGVMAAELVRLGATGVDDVLSGENNFVATFAPK